MVIVSSGYLPQPATEGGAVETLTDMLIEYNERVLHKKQYVFSVDNEAAIDMSKKYVYTTFIYVHSNSLKYRIIELFCKVARKLFKINCGNAYIREVRKLSKELKLSNQDLLIENDYIYLKYLKDIFNNKKILHLHNDYINSDKIINCNILGEYTKIITVSQYIADRVKEIDNKLPVCTVYNGIEKAFFVPSNENKSDNGKYIMFSGRLKPYKGIEELIVAFNKIKNKNVFLYVAGLPDFINKNDHSYLDYLKTLSSDKIRFLGYVKREELIKYYSNCLFSVIPSQWEEPFGLSLVEPMAAGKPIIRSDCKAFDEIIDRKSSIVILRGENFIDQLTKEMDYLIENEEERIELGKKSYERAINFTSETYCAHMYRELET